MQTANATNAANVAKSEPYGFASGFCVLHSMDSLAERYRDGIAAAAYGETCGDRDTGLAFAAAALAAWAGLQGAINGPAIAAAAVLFCREHITEGSDWATVECAANVASKIQKAYAGARVETIRSKSENAKGRFYTLQVLLDSSGVTPGAGPWSMRTIAGVYSAQRNGNWFGFRSSFAEGSSNLIGRAFHRLSDVVEFVENETKLNHAIQLLGK